MVYHNSRERLRWQKISPCKKTEHKTPQHIKKVTSSITTLSCNSLNRIPPPPLFLKSKRLNRKYSPIHPNYYKWIQQNPLNHSKLNVAYQSPLLDPEKLELCALGPTRLSQLSIGQQRKCRKMKFPAFPLSKSNWHNWFGFFKIFFFFTQKKKS